MRILFLSTSSNETIKYAESLGCLNPESVAIIRYDDENYVDSLVIAKAKEYAPDFTVYIGSRWGAQVTILTLARLNAEIARTVHICSDAADPPWHDLLMEYHYAGAFALQVAIDGNNKWPLHGTATGMTALTPIDPARFNGVKPHAERTIACGYAGNPGSEGSFRRYLLSELMFHKAIDVRLRSNAADTYQGMCDYMQNCRISLNLSHTGTQAAKQVKGRVVEAALAGSCLLELAESPTRDWFTAGEDFLEYQRPGDAIETIQHYSKHPEETQAIARRLREKVLAEHTPIKFWTKILTRIGVTG